MVQGTFAQRLGGDAAVLGQNVFFKAALICLQRRSSSTKPIYSVKSSLFTVCICSSNTIEGFVRPKSSPKIMWDGKYLFFITLVMDATITVGAFALKLSA